MFEIGRYCQERVLIVIGTSQYFLSLASDMWDLVEIVKNDY